MEPITQLEAAKRGLSRFYTGRPCHRGHYAERYVAGGTCVECQKERERERYRELQRIRREAKEDASNG